MRRSSVRFRKQLDIRGRVDTPLSIGEAISKVKQMATVSSNRSYRNGKRRKDPDQTVDLVVHLGIDPKQADQMVRGSIALPNGTGKTKRVVAFCDGDMAGKAKAAGAIEAGADELVDKISKGWMDFDVAVAHPSMMGKIAKLGRVLGPQGKMPSPKSGTVTTDIETGVREYAGGKLEYRNDAGGNIHLPVGKTSFPVEALKENVEAIIGHLQRVRPSSTKGTYMKRACLSATRTPSVGINVGS